MKLIHINEMFPQGKIDVETFVNIMKEVLKDTAIVKRENFVEEIVDLFFRAKSEEGNYIKFEDLTSYLIEHEIEGNDSGAN